MGGKKSRNKGARWEQELVRILRGWGATNPTRNWSQSLYGNGGDVPDVEVTIDGIRYAFECKTGSKISWKAAMDQAQRMARATEIPIVAGKYDREAPLVMLRLTDFLHILGLMEGADEWGL